MDAIVDELRDLLDRDAVRRCVAGLARAEDRRDAEAVRGAFWPDAAVDFGIFAGSFDDYLAWVVPGSPAIAVTQHVLGQTLAVPSGDTAKAETHVTAYHRVDTGDGGERDIVLGGRYLDRLERRGGQWRIVFRTMLYDWTQDVGASADFSQGLMGAPFSSDRFTGRSAGDPSEEFFTKP